MRTIKKLRIMQGLTQKNLAERVCISRANLTNIENGRRTPSMKTARKIAAALGCTIDELFERETEEAAEAVEGSEEK